MSIERRRHRPVENQIPQEILGGEITRVRDSAEREVAKARERFDVDGVSTLAKEALSGGDPRLALSLASDLKAATRDTIKLFKMRGFDVDALGKSYEDAIGGGKFEGSAIPADASHIEVVEAALSETAKAWGGLSEAVGTQAQSRALKRMDNLAPGAPANLKTEEERVIRDMITVWQRSADETILGGRIEDLRSGLGLRTLAALEGRYMGMEYSGSDEAMPRGYLWAQRAYWLTKHALKRMMDRPEHRNKRESLYEIGLEYNSRMGDQYLSAPGAMDIEVGDTSWTVVQPLIKATADAWTKIKGVIG